MNKKAFTLIELLAVIVILAIISLIAVPIVINIINDSKMNSQKRSIDLYAKAVEQSVANYQLKTNKKVEGKFNTTDGKTLTRDDITLNVDYKGNVVCNRIVVNKDGSIYLSECTVDGDKVYISKDEGNKENPNYYEYGKTEYGMIMERTVNSEFLNTGIVGYRISYFKILNTLNIENKETYNSSDCSYNKDGSVICYWKELENKSGYYDVILASDGEMYTPPNSTLLFSLLGHQSLQNDLDVSKLNTKYTTNMSHMFENAGACNSTYQKIILGDKFDTSNVIDMSNMFAYTDYTSNLILGDKFDTSSVTNMSGMFKSLGSNQFYFKTLNLGDKFDTSNVIDMSLMFSNMGRKYLETFSLGDHFNTEKVTNMNSMFDCMGFENLETFSLGDKFNTSNVTNMNCMFCAMGYKKLEKFNLGDQFYTNNVIDMNQMFDSLGHDNMTELNLGNHFDTSKAKYMSGMFANTGYKKLKKLDLGKSFFAPQGNYSSVSNMFGETGKESLKELYLWNFDYSKAGYYSRDNVFKDCGTDGVLTKVVVSSEDIKTKILNNSSTPQFWKDNNIVQVQSN